MYTTPRWDVGLGSKRVEWPANILSSIGSPLMGLGRENATEYIPDLDRKIFFQKYFKISYYLF